MADTAAGGEDEILLSTRIFDVVRRHYQAADGSRHQRAVVEHPGAVTILPLLDAEHVCLIENFRIAVRQTLIELPAGTLEPGEDPLNTARRELTEETGYRAGTIQRLTEFYLSPGILNERMHLYLATELSPGDKQLEAGEQIENLVVPFSTALSWIDDGRIQDAKTIVGLLYYSSRQRAEGRGQ